MSATFHHLDRATRLFWRLKGKPIDTLGAERWLRGPTNHDSVVADSWLNDVAKSLGGYVDRAAQNSGLLRDFSELDGPTFRASELHHTVRQFYEHTSDWEMEVNVRWTPAFRPGGWFISRYFGQRVEQLALPLSTREGPEAIDSKVVPIRDNNGEQQAAAWLRTLRSTGSFVYSGCYSFRRLPNEEQPSVHVVFPLQAGNVQVFLRPEVLPGGALRLRSAAGLFGDGGTYVVVIDGGRTYAARAPINEEFHVWVDSRGLLHTDHTLRLWSAPVVRMHYLMQRREQ